MHRSILHDMPGGTALFDWFGRVPHFHDAELLEVTLSTKGSGLLRIHTWEITDNLDAHGYYVLDKHVVVTLALEGISVVDCADFDMAPGIIFDLAITRAEQRFRIEWSASYGVAGSIVAKQVRVILEPGRPDLKDSH
jgi:hypothetical protein